MPRTNISSSHLYSKENLLKRLVTDAYSIKQVLLHRKKYQTTDPPPETTQALKTSIPSELFQLVLPLRNDFHHQHLHVISPVYQPALHHFLPAAVHNV